MQLAGNVRSTPLHFRRLLASLETRLRSCCTCCRPVMQLANGVRDQSSADARAAAAQLAAAAKRAKARPQVGTWLGRLINSPDFEGDVCSTAASRHTMLPNRRMHLHACRPFGRLRLCATRSACPTLQFSSQLDAFEFSIRAVPTCGVFFSIWLPPLSVSTQSQPDAFEFSIRTPVTPARWQDYDEVGPFCCACFIHSMRHPHATLCGRVSSSSTCDACTHATLAWSWGKLAYCSSSPPLELACLSGLGCRRR